MYFEYLATMCLCGVYIHNWNHYVYKIVHCAFLFLIMLAPHFVLPKGIYITL